MGQRPSAGDDMLAPMNRIRAISASRRNFLRGTLGSAALIGLGAPLLAACGPKPSSPGAVQSAIADGLQPEAGPLRLFNYADFIAPEVVAKFEDEHKVKIEITTFATEQEGVNKLAQKAVDVDVFQAASEPMISRLISSGLVQPVNRSYLPDFDNLIPTYQDQWYDPGSTHSVPFVAFSLGIGYRTDRITREEIEAKGWDILADDRFRGTAAVVDDYRNALGYHMLRTGEDVNSGDDAVIDASLKNLIDLADRNNIKVNNTQYQDIPEGNTTVSLAWNGDMIGAIPYLPAGTSPDVLGWWYPADNRSIIGTDLAAVTTVAKNPVLAHMWMNYLLKPEIARMQFLQQGFQVPITGLDPAKLAADAGIPPLLAGAIFTDDVANNGLRQKELAVDVDRKWEDAWSTFTSR